jgi:hypothetical protein
MGFTMWSFGLGNHVMNVVIDDTYNWIFVVVNITF